MRFKELRYRDQKKMVRRLIRYVRWKFDIRLWPPSLHIILLDHNPEFEVTANHLDYVDTESVANYVLKKLAR